jgi:SepF-like predicted cell division protein (DUF552 family)
LSVYEPNHSRMRARSAMRSPIRFSRSGFRQLVVRASDKKCLVVDIEPTGKDKNVTKIGKDAYPTREEAEADVKRLCKQ